MPQALHWLFHSPASSPSSSLSANPDSVSRLRSRNNSRILLPGNTISDPAKHVSAGLAPSAQQTPRLHNDGHNVVDDDHHQHQHNPHLLQRTWLRLHDRSSTTSITTTTATLPASASVIDMPSTKPPNGPGNGGQVSHRLRNFFRMNTTPSEGSANKERDKSLSSSSGAGVSSPSRDTIVGSSSDAVPVRPSRHTRLFTSTVGRLRAHTVASEGNQLDEAMSPTANANPYFAHQGQPGLRHHNHDSVPPSPPDTPVLKVSGPDGLNAAQSAGETKEELARRLRRVASAPNTQGLFAKGGGGDRPATAELGKDPLMDETGSLSLVETKFEVARNLSLGVHSADDVLAPLPPPPLNGTAFRRTYSSNSIKVKNVEVGPASFDKIKLIGKGDVGKVYLVREKKSNRLYAMKGKLHQG